MIRIFIKSFVICFLLLASTSATSQKNGLKDTSKSLNPEEQLGELRCLSLKYINFSPDSAILYGTKALEIARDASNIILESEILRDLGLSLTKKGDFSQALENLKASLKIKVEINDSVGMADVHNAIGNIYRYFGNYNFALEATMTAFKIYQALNDSTGIGESMNNLGLIHRSLDNYSEAIEYYKQALEIRKTIDDQKGISETLKNIGNFYWHIKEYHTALDYYEKSLEINQNYLTNKEELSGILNNLGNTYRELGDLVKANIYYQQSLNISEEIGDNKLISVTLKNIGVMYKKQNMYNQALQYLEPALKLARKIGYSRIISEILLNESEIYEITKNPTQALIVYKQYVALNDSIFSSENTRKITEYNTRYEIEKKEKEIQTLENERQRSFKNLLGAMLIMLIIVSVIIFHRYLQKNKTNLILQEQQKQILEKSIELASLNQELILEKERAETSDKLKSEFLAQISHEIRSPTNTILNYASLIELELADCLEYNSREYFNSINNASSRLIRTIDLVLNMSELEIGSYKPIFENIELINNLVDPIVLEFKNTAYSKGLSLSMVNKINHEIILRADHYTLSQILTNLLDNAIKYTNKGSVEVKIDTIEDQVVISIADTGIGIDEKYISKLFEKFSQEEQGYTRKFEGSGLGLALVKNYCEINNAQIVVKSKKGLGSTFEVIFSKEANVKKERHA